MQVVWFLISLVVVALVLVALKRVLKRQESDRAAGIFRFGICKLSGDELHLGGGLRRMHMVTPETHAEVVGAPQDVRRSTVTRTVAGGVVAGPVGALAGHAAKKKVRTDSVVLTIEGEDWAETIPVPTNDYAQAVSFAQNVNLAARTSAKKR